MQLFFFLFGFYNSTCFGRSLRPSSVVLQTVVAATGVSWVWGRINPVWESLAVCIIFHGSLGLMAWWCTL